MSQTQTVQQMEELEKTAKVAQETPGQLKQKGQPTGLRSKWWLWLIIIVAVVVLGTVLYLWLV